MTSEPLRAEQRVNQITENKHSGDAGDDVIHKPSSVYRLPSPVYRYRRSHALTKYQQATRNNVPIERKNRSSNMVGLIHENNDMTQ
jgi:hypothetical protein